MENSENNTSSTPASSSTPKLGSELEQHQQGRVSSSSLTTIAVISLIFGVIGGAVSSIYLPSVPAFQKYLIQLPSATVNQKVTLSEDSAIIDVVKKVSPAVVSIIISKDVSKLPGFSINPFGGDPFSQFFGFNFGQPQQQPPQQQQQTPNIQEIGAGSGFFVTADGLILTNRHVVSDEQASYTVLTNNGKRYDAKVLARDTTNDLAIIKIEIKDAPTVLLGDSSQIQIGERVVAIGNSLGQYQNTVTSGIVSGIGRSVTAGDGTGSEQLEGAIQTDAAINPGNSGGPLLDIDGKAIGINTAIDRQGQLVGFALPINDVKLALDSFQKQGRIIHPFLGVRYVLITSALATKQKLSRDYGALLVRGQNPADAAVIPGSPADKAGLQENDIILEVNGTRVDESNSLIKLLKAYKVGDTINLKVFHTGSEKFAPVTLRENK